MLGDHKVTKILKKIEQGFQDCTRKIVSASKFIDYFVHDMLDYTILSKNENFTKTLETFDVRNSVNEIVEILEDKIQMKEIKISVDIKVEDVLITTD